MKTFVYLTIAFKAAQCSFKNEEANKSQKFSKFAEEMVNLFNKEILKIPLYTKPPVLNTKKDNNKKSQKEIPPKLLPKKNEEDESARCIEWANKILYSNRMGLLKSFHDSKEFRNEIVTLFYHADFDKLFSILKIFKNLKIDLYGFYSAFESSILQDLKKIGDFKDSIKELEAYSLLNILLRLCFVYSAIENENDENLILRRFVIRFSELVSEILSQISSKNSFQDLNRGLCHIYSEILYIAQSIFSDMLVLCIKHSSFGLFNSAEFLISLDILFYKNSSDRTLLLKVLLSSIFCRINFKCENQKQEFGSLISTVMKYIDGMEEALKTPENAKAYINSKHPPSDLETAEQIKNQNKNFEPTVEYLDSTNLKFKKQQEAGESQKAAKDCNGRTPFASMGCNQSIKYLAPENLVFKKPSSINPGEKQEESQKTEKDNSGHISFAMGCNQGTEIKEFLDFAGKQLVEIEEHEFIKMVFEFKMLNPEERFKFTGFLSLSTMPKTRSMVLDRFGVDFLPLLAYNSGFINEFIKVNSDLDTILNLFSLFLITQNNSSFSIELYSKFFEENIFNLSEYISVNGKKISQNEFYCLIFKKIIMKHPNIVTFNRSRFIHLFRIHNFNVFKFIENIVVDAVNAKIYELDPLLENSIRLFIIKSPENIKEKDELSILLAKILKKNCVLVEKIYQLIYGGEYYLNLELEKLQKAQP